jgi:hypothetical protein
MVGDLMMGDLVQIIIVTAAALAALAAIVIPYFRKPKAATPGCAHCPSARQPRRVAQPDPARGATLRVVGLERGSPRR